MGPNAPSAEHTDDPNVMRVDVRVDRPDHTGPWAVVIETADGERATHSMRALRDGRWSFPQPGPDVPAAGTKPSELCAAPASRIAEVVGHVTERKPVGDDIVSVGRWLFDVLIGEAAWDRVREMAKTRHPRVVELALWWSAEDGDLHRLPWELMHDGRRFLSVYLDFPIAIVRRVYGEGAVPEPIDHVPRVLFAVGTDLTDPAVRPGAELLGLLRELEFEGGSIHSYVVQQASVSRIKAAVERFKPDATFLIGHGDVHPTTRDGVVQLRNDDRRNSAEPQLVDADQLMDALTNGGAVAPPRVVVLSMCHGAVAGGPTTAPFAARLVQLGAGMVVGMSGRVGDQACRLFTRRFGRGLVTGEAIAEAAAHGRRAAFSQGNDPPSSCADWALPTLFLAHRVPMAFRPVRTENAGGVAQLVSDFGLATSRKRPVFCGRLAFFELYERLVSRTDTLSALAIYAENLEGLGPNRLLKEISAQAIRDGHVPLLLGPYDNVAQPPRSPVQLAADLVGAMLTAAGHLDVTVVDSHLLAFVDVRGFNERTLQLAALRQAINRLRKDNTLDFGAEALGEALKDDFAMLADAARRSPRLPAHEGTVVLVLLPGVHEWDGAFTGLIEMLGTNGLGTRQNPVPVILTGSLEVSGGSRLAYQMREPKLNDAYFHHEKLTPFAGNEDLLAYQWVLLHPRPEFENHVYAVISEDDDWQTHLRARLTGRPLDFDRALYDSAYFLHVMGMMSKDDDEAALRQLPTNVP